MASIRMRRQVWLDGERMWPKGGLNNKPRADQAPTCTEAKPLCDAFAIQLLPAQYPLRSLLEKRKMTGVLAGRLRLSAFQVL